VVSNLLMKATASAPLIIRPKVNEQSLEFATGSEDLDKNKNTMGRASPPLTDLPFT
jgi:hypothetical protein